MVHAHLVDDQRALLPATATACPPAPCMHRLHVKRNSDLVAEQLRKADTMIRRIAGGQHIIFPKAGCLRNPCDCRNPHLLTCLPHTHVMRGEDCINSNACNFRTTKAHHLGTGGSS